MWVAMTGTAEGTMQTWRKSSGEAGVAISVRRTVKDSGGLMGLSIEGRQE